MLESENLPLSLRHLESLILCSPKENRPKLSSTIKQLFEKHGFISKKHFVRCVFTAIGLSPSEPKFTQSEVPQVRFLIQTFSSIIANQDFPTIFCYSLERPLPSAKISTPLGQLLAQLSRVLKLSHLQDVVLGLSFTFSSDAHLVEEAEQWVREKLPDIFHSYTRQSAGQPEQQSSTDSNQLLHKQLGVGLLHFVLERILDAADHIGCSTDHLDALLSELRQEYPRNLAPTILHPILYADLRETPSEVLSVVSSPEKEPTTTPLGLVIDTSSPPKNVLEDVLDNPSLADDTLLADLLEEMGCASTNTVEDMRRLLSEFGPFPITPRVVAKCLCLFLRVANDLTSSPVETILPSQDATKSSFMLYSTARPSTSDSTESPSSYNVDNFINAILETCPNLSLNQVLYELDCPEFCLPNRTAFVILKQYLDRCSSMVVTPTVFYRRWKHARRQFSVLQACYLYPEVFSPSNWRHRSTDLSPYRLNPREEHSSYEIWRNIDYVNAFLSLSERGLYSEVYGILQQTFHSCPNVLTATLLETNPCTLRSVMLSHAMVYYLSPRQNSATVLQAVWNNSQRNQLSPQELQHQRFLLLSATVECVSQLLAGVEEPSTIPSVDQSVGPSCSSNVQCVLDLLCLVTDTTSGRGASLLPILLGTSEGPSNVVASMLRSMGYNASVSANIGSVVSHVLPPPIVAIDLGLSLLMRLAGLVSQTSSQGTLEQPSMNAIQHALRVFLPQWFAECMRDPETGESFARGIIEYLELRYGCTLCTSEVITSKSAISISALPGELRRPNTSLLSHIVQAAHTAIKSPTTHLRQSTFAEIIQSLNTFTQSLGLNSGASTSGSSRAPHLGPSIPPSAFALAMKSNLGLGAANPNPQQLAQQPVLRGNMLPQFAQADLTSALAAAAAANSFNPANSEDFSRSLVPFSSRSGVQQPGSLSMNNQLKAADGTSMHNCPLPSDYQPIALPFNNEPIKMEMSEETEAEAYGFFQKLLKGSSTPDEMFKTVCEYATQGNFAQRKLLDGILRMLADEVSQYLPDYPEAMLPLIADLYGSILAASTQLLSIRALSMLWRALLSRMHSMNVDTTDSPLYRAIILIMVKAKNTFAQFYNLPSCLVACPVFKIFPHELQEFILNAEMMVNTYFRSQQGKLLPGGTSRNLLATGNQFWPQQAIPPVSTVLSLYSTQPEPPFKPPDPPEESVSDRIYFLFNNVSQSNVKDKSAELAELLSEERHLPWFAFYLVGKRVPVEHTFHDLFALVLDQIQERVPTLRPKVLQELLRNIKLLLRNMRRDRDDMQARTTLKNLGNFLGLITLARNKPLLHDDLNVKDLVYEAYHKGPVSSQYVVPFVARVVKGAAHSIVFKPPNPWTMAILKVFRELYDLKDVKSCLRFEIELLYQQFSLKTEDVPMVHFIRDRNHANNLEVQLCFFIPTETPTSTSTAAATTGAIVTATGGDSIVATPSTSVPDVASTAASSLPPQSQHVLNILAALQKQNATSGQPVTAAGLDLASAANAANLIPPMYSTSGADLVSLVQSSLAAGPSGPANSNARALVVAAALAASQRQKQLQQQQQQQPTQTPFSSSTTVTPSSTSFPLQPKQIAAAMAALQQLQSQNVTPPAPFNPPPPSVPTIPDSTVEVPQSNLRYEDVSIRSIRASLNLDEILTAAAASTSRTGNQVNQAAISLLQSNPRLRSMIEPAIIRAISDLTTPVFERCARITVTTVAAVVRKDFALDPDPNRMLYAARQMVRHLAAGMSLITARETLGMSLVTSLKNIILAEVHSASGQEKEAVQRLAHLVVAKTMHTCLAFMQKSVAEKAVSDVEKKLEPDVKLRTELGMRKFLEQASTLLAPQQACLPELLRLRTGGPTPAEMSVYEEFGRVIPGFAPSSFSNTATAAAPPAPATAQMAAYLQQQQDFANRLHRQIPSTGQPSAQMLKPSMLSQQQQQQQQQSAHLNKVPSQQHLLMQQQQAPLNGLLDIIIGQMERHLEFISARLCSTTDPIVRALRALLDAMLVSKQNRDANMTISVVIQSFLEHYRPSLCRDQQRSLEAMEYLKEAHMLTLRHMLSSDQTAFGYAWVTRQVTQVWISLDGGSVPKDTATENNQDKKPLTESETSASKSKAKPEDAASSEITPDVATPRPADPIKWNWEAFVELLKVHVVYLSQVDAYLAQEVSSGHPGAITFVIDLLDHFVLPCPAGSSVGAAAAAAATYARQSNADTTQSGQLSQLQAAQSRREFTVLNEYDLWSTLEAMRIRVGCLNALLPSRPVTLTDPLGLRLRLACARVRGLLDLGLIEQSPLFSTATTAIGAFYSGCSQAREFDDPPNLQENVELVMHNWFEIYQSNRQQDPATIKALLGQLVQIGVLPNLDNLTRFLRLATIFVIERALKQLRLQEQQQQSGGSAQSALGTSQQPPQQQQQQQASLSGSGVRVAAYAELDAYARLISIIINRSGDQLDQPNIKIVLLNKVLGLIAGTLLQEHEVRREWFHPMPFERILIVLFVELHALAPPPFIDPNDPNDQQQDKSSAQTPVNLTLQQQLPLIFCHLLHCLRPEKATAFVFSWLEMVAHRWFVGRLLAMPVPSHLKSTYQAMYAQLLVDLLKFLGFFLQNAIMPKPIQCLYKATLRLLLVLIHDFPEFVADYYALFCDVVPSNSIQMRNLILSALPKRGITVSDPLQAPPVDNLASLEDPTGYCMEAGSRLPEPMRLELDAYLATRAPVKLLSELVTTLRRADDIVPPLPPAQFAHHPQQQARHQQALAAYAAALAANDGGGPSIVKVEDKEESKGSVKVDMSDQSTADTPGESGEQSGNSSALRTSTGLSSSSATAAALLWGMRATQQLATFGLSDGMHYNVELMTNLTLYVCITAIRNLREKGMPLNMATIAHTPQMDIIQSLVLNLDNEGRYLLLNCMANHLRYPNSHTYYFSYTILYLFSEQSKEQVKEQISRVLMERLIVNRPHPWGLLMTSAELLRNPAYRFWEHEFARCNPEIEAIVTIVARSCIPNFQIPAPINPPAANTQTVRNPLISSAISSGPVSTDSRRRPASPLTRGAAAGGTNAAADGASAGSSSRSARVTNAFIPG